MPLMHPYVKILPPGRRRELAASTNHIPWWPYQLCLSYGWPTNLAGGGTIGIVELGGGWTHSDINQYFKYGNNGHHLPVPNIIDVSVDPGITNSPGSEADVEVILDIELAATAYSMATGKPANIRMYWANNDALGIARGVAKAAVEGCDVISISWGADEADWGPTNGITMDLAAATAVASGSVVFAASGDNNSSDGGPGAANVDLPASSPHVIGCGGTDRPHNSSSSNLETVWNNNPGNSDGEGTGGGFSSLFPWPIWQVGVPSNAAGGRMVPDVSANADPVTGYRIVYGGQDVVVGGTSAVAPLYAGLFAAFGRKLGFIIPKLWANPKNFTDIIKGDNGVYHAVTGPDPCTGLGSPKAAMLAELFARAAA